MSLSAILTIATFAAVCVGLVLWMRSRKREHGDLPMHCFRDHNSRGF